MLTFSFQPVATTLLSMPSGKWREIANERATNGYGVGVFILVSVMDGGWPFIYLLLLFNIYTFSVSIFCAMPSMSLGFIFT